MYERAHASTEYISCLSIRLQALIFNGFKTLQLNFSFKDNCGIAPKDANLKFFSFDKSIGISAFDCNSKTVPGAKETDDTWWKTLGNPVSISSSKFLCAKSQFSGSYIVNSKFNTVYLQYRVPLVERNLP